MGHVMNEVETVTNEDGRVVIVPEPEPDELLTDCDRVVEMVAAARGVASNRWPLCSAKNYAAYPLGDAKVGKSLREAKVKSFERLPEAVVYDPKVQLVPIATTTSSKLAALRMEDRYWSTGGHYSTVVSLGSIDVSECQYVATRMYNSSPLMRRVVRILTSLTIGGDIKVTFKDANGKEAKGKNKAWKKRFKKVFDQKAKHIVQQTAMLGEGFSVRLPLGRNRTSPAEDVRWVEPDRIPYVYLGGIDAEKTLGYQWRLADGSTTTLKPDQVIHWRFDQTGNEVRSIPPATSALRWIRESDLFAEGRMWVNRIRSRYPVVVEAEGSAAQLGEIKVHYQKLPPPATVQINPSGTRTTFPPQNVGASDVQDDWRLLIQLISAATGIPEFLLVSTAGSDTFSGTLMQESPLVVQMEDFQHRLTPGMRTLAAWVSGEPEDRIELAWPSVVKRGIGELAAALGVGVQNKFLSRQSAAEAIDRQWEGPEGEKSRIQREEGEGMFDGFGMAITARDPFQKKADGGVGEPPEGVNQGAAAPTDGSRGDGAPRGK